MMLQKENAYNSWHLLVYNNPNTFDRSGSIPCECFYRKIWGFELSGVYMRHFIWPEVEELDTKTF